mgnify:CR=1 FL=1
MAASKKSKETGSPYAKEKAFKKRVSIFSSTSTSPLIKKLKSRPTPYSSPSTPISLTTPTTYSTASSTVGDFTYIGNPTQPHMAKSTNAPKYHLITAQKVLGTNADAVVTVNIYNTLNDSSNSPPSTGYDYVIGISDMTPAGAMTHVINATATHLTVTYASSVLPSAAFERKIRVKWYSGWSRDFWVLIPGRNSISNTPYEASATNYSSYTNDCSTNNQWNFKNSAFYGPFTISSGDFLKIYFTKAVLNPGALVAPTSNRFPEGQMNSSSIVSSGTFDDFGFGDFSIGPLSGYTNIYDLNYITADLSQISEVIGWAGLTNMHQIAKPTPDLGLVEQEYRTIITAYSTSSPYDNEVPYKVPYDLFDPSNFSLGFNSSINSPIPYDKQRSNLMEPPAGFFSYYGGDGLGVSFRSIIMYAYNIPGCEGDNGDNGDGTTYTIDGCTDDNNMAYWGYTGQDCASVAIPTEVQNNQALASWTPGSCCPDCINPEQESGHYSPQPLTLNVQSTDPTTIGGTDGYIDVTIVDGGFDSSEIPSGLPTGVANYTYVVQNIDATDTMCGNTAGLGVGSGAVANTSFTFGNSVPANANGGLLQTGATGSSTYAASAAQGYVPGGTSTSAPYGLGTTNSEGFREGCYKVYVFDSSTTVCLGQTQICLTDPDATVGCTDSDALNYDSTATIPDNTNCDYCEATNGKINAGSVVGAQYQSNIAQSTGNIATITNATNTTSTDAEINITGISATSDFQNYINNIVSGTTQNADYYVALYRWDSQTVIGNSTWASTNLLTAFNAGTTIVGTAINNQDDGWNINLTSNTLGAGITYGYYSIKVWVDDPDSLSEQEQCYEIFDVMVPVPACVDGGVATAADGVVIIDLNLFYHDPSLCNIVNNYCCDAPSLIESPASTTCNIEYKVYLECDLSQNPSVDISLEYFDNGTWVPTSYSNQYLYPLETENLILTLAQSVFTEGYGSGNYRVKSISQYSDSPDCILYSNVENITLGVFGCMEEGASDYNPLATCDNGCSWPNCGCTNPMATNYDETAECDDGTCIVPNMGCTDITASNYNPDADMDDGSCQWTNCGCTDPLAYNYGENIAGQVAGDPPECDDGNCQYCEDPPMQVSFTGDAATCFDAATCSYNCDGTIELTVTSATGCTNYTIIYMYFFCGISNSNVYYIQDQEYTTGTTILTGLCSGHTWTLLLEDCNGCQQSLNIGVLSEGCGACGCTDPAAANYSAVAITDDGSCEYCGCTDDGAINYNPEATANCDPDTCEFPALLPPCIPPTINQTFRQVQTCIAENGFKYHNKLLMGKTDDCSIMNVWKLILIDYLLKKKGLDCIYNCADANTPDAADVYISCNDLWITGGTTTGLNDPNVNALIPAVGTTSTKDMFILSCDEQCSPTYLHPGDVIKHHDSGNIWIFFGPGQGSTSSGVNIAGLDPENASGNESGYWGYCNDNMRYISNTNNINYIDNFINFVNTFCRDCGNDPQLIPSKGSPSFTGDTFQKNMIDTIDDIEI